MLAGSSSAGRRIAFWGCGKELQQRRRQELFIAFFLISQFEFRLQPQFILKRRLEHGWQFVAQFEQRWQQQILQLGQRQELQLRLHLERQQPPRI